MYDHDTVYVLIYFGFKYCCSIFYSCPGTNDDITMEDLVDDFVTFYVAGKVYTIR